jgi:hypothetical protein
MCELAEEMGIARKNVEAHAGQTKNFSFAFRSIEGDALSADKNNHDGTEVVGRFYAKQLKSSYEYMDKINLEGTITKPEGKIAIRFSTKSDSETYVYDKTVNKFLTEVSLP